MRRLLCVLLFTSIGVSVAHAADTYTSGHGALQVFDEQGWQLTPEWVKAWISIMALSFLLGVVFVKNHIAARWVVGGFVAGVLFNQIGFPYLGLAPISGLIALTHLLFWAPGLYQLVREQAFLGPLSAYSVWTAWMTLVILFSFVFDLRDATIYLHHVLLQ